MKKTKKHKCVSCGKPFPQNKIEYAPDPYASDVYDDNTKVWMCEECRKCRSEEI